MSIWCSTREVRCLDYGHSAVYPWENAVEESSSTVDFAYVADYVYDPDAHGDELMPYLRLSVATPEGQQTVVLTEKGVRAVLTELTEWLDTAKRKCPRRRRLHKKHPKVKGAVLSTAPSPEGPPPKRGKP
jgi:hypothetical protein